MFFQSKEAWRHFVHSKREGLAALITGKDWSRAFFDPIELPDGRLLATLEDAAEHITELPASEHDLPHWRAAVAALILSAERGESGADPMLARSRSHVCANRNTPSASTWSAKDTVSAAEESGQEVQAGPLSDSRIVMAPARVFLCGWHHSDHSLRCSLRREAAKQRSNENLTPLPL